MKNRKIIVALVLALMLAMPALGEGELLSAADVQLRMQENPILNIFDVRAAEKYDEGHLHGAVNFPLDMLEYSVQSILDSGFSYMEAEIIVYGDSNEDGWEAVKILNNLGFANVFNLGSMENWDGELISTEKEMQEAMRLLGDLDTQDIYGNKVDDSLLSEYKLTMVNVWATYCNSCIEGMPEMAKLYHAWKEKGVQIVGLVSDGVDGESALGCGWIGPGEPLGEYAAKLLEICSRDRQDDATVAAIRLHPTSLYT